MPLFKALAQVIRFPRCNNIPLEGIFILECHFKLPFGIYDSILVDQPTHGLYSDN